MLRVVTDGAADMPPEWEKQFDIQTIPINIQFGDKTYLQNVDINTARFYEMVNEAKNDSQDFSTLSASVRGVLSQGCKKRRYDHFRSRHQQIIRNICVRGFRGG